MPDPDLGELAKVVALYAELVSVTALEFGPVGRRGLEQMLVAVAIATVDLEVDLGTGTASSQKRAKTELVRWVRTVGRGKESEREREWSKCGFKPPQHSGISPGADVRCCYHRDLVSARQMFI